MKAICVDDEPILLKWLLEVVKQSGDIDEAIGFQSGLKAVDYAIKNDFDVAFIDVELGKMNGIELAKRLREIKSQCGIIFCTGHANYAVDAIKDLIVNGYLLKPIEYEDVQEEIDKFINYNRISRPIITVDLSHDIEVFDRNGNVIQFKRKLTLKLLLELVKANGKSISVAELCSKLWKDNDDPYLFEKNKDYLSHLVLDLRKAIESDKNSEIIRKDFDGFAVNMSLIKVIQKS